MTLASRIIDIHRSEVLNLFTCHFHVLNELLTTVLGRAILIEVRSLDTSPLGLDGLSRSVVLLGDLISDADDSLVWRAFVEVIVEVLQCAVGSFWVEKVHDWDKYDVCGIGADSRVFDRSRVGVLQSQWSAGMFP